MPRVAVRIFHPPAPAGDGPLAGWLHAARTSLAGELLAGFRAAGAADVAIVSETDAAKVPRPFGQRLRSVVNDVRSDGLVVVGSGALPLAERADHRMLVAAAGGPAGTVLANNRFSADVVAIAGLEGLANVPDLASDNQLPRWLESAGYRVRDVRDRWRLAVDLDSPLDIILGGGAAPRRGWAASTPPGRAESANVDLGAVQAALAAIARTAADPRAELAVLGRTSSKGLAWLEGRAAARIRATVEERGLHAASGDGTNVRPPASILGLLLDHEGPGALGAVLARLADGAIVDSRVLLAHCRGGDERGWPPPEDRFASDLLLPERVADPWLRELTASARNAPIPVVLGGHGLVGPGLRLLARSNAVRTARASGASRLPGEDDDGRR